MFAERPVFLPRFTGYLSRGLLLHVLRRVDPSISEFLHRPDVPKPYSVTPLWFKSKGRTEEGFILDPTHPCRVSFRFLKDDLAHFFLRYFYESSSLLIYDTVFNVASLTVNSRSYPNLWEEIPKPIDSFGLRFKTPTYLATMGTDFHYLFPDPQRIFLNLMRLWNSFSDGRRFSKEEVGEYKDWLLKYVGVSKHRLQTRIAYMGEKKATGFIGWVAYEMKEMDEWNRVTCVLARYAEYSNIGGNRTGGFGVTELKIKPGKPPPTST